MNSFVFHFVKFGKGVPLWHGLIISCTKHKFYVFLDIGSGQHRKKPSMAMYTQTDGQSYIFINVQPNNNNKLYTTVILSCNQSICNTPTCRRLPL